MDYENDDGSQNNQTWQDYVKSNIVLILIGVYWLTYHFGGFGAVILIKEEDQCATALLFLLLSMRSVYFSAYRKTPKIIWNGGQCTWTGRRIPVGNYVIHPLGGIRALGFDFMTGNEGHIISPLTSENMAGESKLLSVNADIVDFNTLDLEVQDKIIANDLKPPYYAGYCDEDQLNDILDIKPDDQKVLDVGQIKGVGGIKKVNVDFLISQLKKTNQHVSMLSRLLNGQGDDLEKVVGNWSRIYNKAKQKGSTWQNAIFEDKDK